MKKRNEFDEFIKQLEKAIDTMMNEIESFEDKPININVSVNLCPYMLLNSDILDHKFESKTHVDIIETKSKIHAVIGIPGMKMEDIILNCNGETLEITADNGEKTMSECIELPAKVNKTGIKTTYNNGVLEIIFNKKKIKSSKKKT